MTEQNTPRLRVSHVIVQPVLVYDDGDELAPGPTMQPTQVRLSELPGLADEIRASVAQADAQGGQPQGA